VLLPLVDAPNDVHTPSIGSQSAEPAPGQITLRWYYDPEATGYSVWRWNGTNREKLVNVLGGATRVTFTDSGAISGTTYRYSMFGKYADPNTVSQADITIKAP
jgi:hypothetical protein